MLHCAWCQTDINDLEPMLHSHHGEAAQSICSDCLIELLPKQLTPARQTYISGLERRITERLPLLSKVYVARGGQTGTLSQVLILNISESGVKLESEYAFQKGDRVIVGFIGKRLIYKALGVVMNMTPLSSNPPFFQMGIQLTGIHQEMNEGTNFHVIHE